jgi:hypothetical protein
MCDVRNVEGFGRLAICGLQVIQWFWSTLARKGHPLASIGYVSSSCFDRPRLLVFSSCGKGAGCASVQPAARQFRDTSMLVPPPGAKVAIVEWEDLECPACAHAFPFVHMAVDHYKIPLVRYDFLIPGHIWSREGAMYARYLQDKVSPELATQYRREVFASQFKIRQQGRPEPLYPGVLQEERQAGSVRSRSNRPAGARGE